MLRFITNFVILISIGLFEVQYDQVINLFLLQLSASYFVLAPIFLYQSLKLTSDTTSKLLVIPTFLLSPPFFLYKFYTATQSLFPNASQSLGSIILCFIIIHVSSEVYSLYKHKPKVKTVASMLYLKLFVETLVVPILPIYILAKYGTSHNTVLISFLAFMMIQQLFHNIFSVKTSKEPS